MTRVEWTPEMDAALRDGFARGETLLRVAETVGVAEGTAARRADALGISRRRITDKKPEAARLAPRQTMEMRFAELLAEGVPTKEAGERIGCARGNSMLQRIRDKLGPQAC